MTVTQLPHRFVVCIIVGLTLSVVSTSAHAFPEMIRHAYVNCTTCHVSPTGGGLLTTYGRALSREVLSTWGVEKEEGVLHGLVDPEKMPEWLKVGGDIRAIQTYHENNAVKEGRFIWMQADLAAAVQAKKLTVAGSIGRIEKSGGPAIGSNYYYAMYQPTEEASVRVGHFYPAFGLNTMDHNTSVRRSLGFNPNTETNNVELGWIGEKWNAFLSGVMSPGEISEPAREKAVAAQATYVIGERYKAGASVWSGSSDLMARQMLSAHAILGFTSNFYLLTETDLVWRKTKSNDSNTNGFVNYQRLGYEVIKGLHFIGTYEYSQSNLQDGSTSSDTLGMGTQFFPRPHFEFQAMLQKARMRAAGSSFDDVAYFLAHYYF